MADSQKLDLFGRILENVNQLGRGQANMRVGDQARVGDPSPSGDVQAKLLEAMDPSKPTTIDILAQASGMGLSDLSGQINVLKSLGIITQVDVDGEVGYTMSPSGMKLRQLYVLGSPQ